MDLTDSLDEFEVFNQPSSPEDILKEMSIQRKPQKSLIELIEDQQEEVRLGSPLNLNFLFLLLPCSLACQT